MKKSNLPSSDSQLSKTIQKIFLMSDLFQQSIHSHCSRCECSRDEKIQNDITGLTVFVAWKWSFPELLCKRTKLYDQLMFPSAKEKPLAMKSIFSRNAVSIWTFRDFVFSIIEPIVEKRIWRTDFQINFNSSTNYIEAGIFNDFYKCFKS